MWELDINTYNKCFKEKENYLISVVLGAPRDTVPIRIPVDTRSNNTLPHTVPEHWGTRATRRTIGKSANLIIKEAPC